MDRSDQSNTSGMSDLKHGSGLNLESIVPTACSSERLQIVNKIDRRPPKYFKSCFTSNRCTKYTSAVQIRKKMCMHAFNGLSINFAILGNFEFRQKETDVPHARRPRTLLDIGQQDRLFYGNAVLVCEYVTGDP
jgi:hypothetical protein